MRSKKFLLFSLIVTLALSLSILEGCKGEKRAPKAGAAAKATQQIQTPTLAPPASEQKAPQPETLLSPTKVEPGAALTMTLPPAAALPAPAPALPSIPALGGMEKAAGPPPAPSPAVAQPVPFVPSVVGAKTNIDILLDASGSQGVSFGGRETSKFDIQKTALADVVLQLKQTEFPRNIGIRVFGSQKQIDAHDCMDTVQIYPVSSPNLDAIQKALGEHKAQGESPIAAALEAASKDFPSGTNADQVMVLIADGVDTCGVDPCQTARAIHLANPKIIIHVIGFDLSQEDESKIKCIAENSEGKFYLARTEHELRRWLDEAVNSTIPYNLRLTTVAGATPIPTTITILKGGTDQVIKTEKSFGTKSLSLPPGTYDVLIEYTDSPEIKKPQKIISGVQVLEKTSVEQDINFDLGSITVSSIDTYGKLSPARYQIMKEGNKVAELEGGAEATSFFLAPGTYDIVAEQKEMVPEKITLTESGIEVKSGESIEKTFRFQKGAFALKGATTQNVNIPFLFQIYKAGHADQLVASGAMGAEGGTISLSPGPYDILFIGQDPAMSANPRTNVTGAVITAAETTEITAKFDMGVIKLSAVDGQGNPVQAEFSVRVPTTREEIGKYQMQDAKTPVAVPVPPGTYNIVASSTQQVIEPKPTVLLQNVEVSATTPVERVVKFVFGTVRLRGRNAKEQPLDTKFTIFGGGTDEPIASAPPSSDWLIFQIAPGHYDVKAESMSAEGEVKPYLTIKDIVVEDGKTVSHEAIFTAGKLKIIGRGPNNKIIPCHFKVYQYGADTELINGDTGDDWQIFEIQPGNYYLEAGYVDPIQSVLLKKWINVKVGDNEVVELILRF